MNDSRDFKDAESVRSRPLSHVPSEAALLPPPQADQGGLLSRARNLQTDIWETHGTPQNVFASSLAYSSTPCPRILDPWDDPTARRIPVRANTGQLVVESGDRVKDTIATPRFFQVRQTEIHPTLWWVEIF